MKKLAILFISLCCTVSASAQLVSHPKARDVVKRARAKPVQIAPTSPDETVYERSARDLIYIPRAGDYFLTGEVDLYSQMAEFRSGGARVADFSGYTNALHSSLQGGVTEFLAFGITLGTGYSSAETKRTSGTTSTLKSDGLYSPELSAKFLLYEQGPYRPVDVIMNLNYTPRFGTARTATSASQGNQISPSDKVGIGVGVVRKFDLYQIAGGLNYRLASNGKSENATTGEEITVNSASEINLTGSGQWLLTDHLFLLGELYYAAIGSADSTAISTKTETSGYTAMGMSAGGKYMLNPKNTYISAALGYIVVPEYDSVTAGTRTSVQNYNVTTLSFGIGHSF